MAKIAKAMKKYERNFLIGLVVLLLATFSIGGAQTCAEQQGGVSDYQLGGTFKVSPSERMEISNEEYETRYREYRRLMSAIYSPSLAFGIPGQDREDPFKSTWAHILAYEAAKHAGYRVGEQQLRRAVKEVVSRRMGMEYSDVTHQRFLQQRFHGSPSDFQEALRQIVLKDSFVTPLVESARYQTTYADAFEEWKNERERIDLRYVALAAEPFADSVERVERTRATIEKQETRLRRLSAVAVEVRRYDNLIKSYFEKNEKYPADFAELLTAQGPGRATNTPVDGWGNDLRYTLENDTPDLRSAGPDGAFDTADDVTPQLQKRFETLKSLFNLADALQRSFKATEAWPEGTAALLEPPKPGQLAILKALPKDGWDRDIAYALKDGVPTLTALGEDGEAGGEDDITVTAVEEGAAVVSPGSFLAAHVIADTNDSWERPIRMRLRSAEPLSFRVWSAGPDGEDENDDDVDRGNGAEIRNFFSAPAVKAKFRLEPRRMMEALYVHLPLLSDEVFEKLWEAFPQHRPDDEEKLYAYWSDYRTGGIVYKAAMPGDAENGHGSELIQRLREEGELAEDAETYLVPKGEFLAAPLKPIEPKDDDGEGEDAGDDDGGDDEPGKQGGDDGDDGDGEEDDDEEPNPGDGEPQPGDEEAKPEESADAKLRKEYTENGWREIVIREEFMERLLNDLLVRCDKSAKAVAEWERKKNQPGGVGVLARPEEVTFETLLAGELSEFLVGAAEADKGLQSFRYWKTDKHLTREEVEAHPHLGHPNLSVMMSSRRGEGEYSPAAIQLHSRRTKALVRNLEHLPAEDPPLEDVYDGVFEEYLKKKRLDRAVEELKKLQELVGQKESEDADGGWDAALKAWGDRIAVPYVVESTGLFLGSSPPDPIEVDDDATDEASMATKRRNYVLRTGYSTVRPSASKQDTVEAAPGTFGRRILQDRPTAEGGTESAFLIRVADRRYPSKAELSPERYARFLVNKIFGGPENRSPRIRLGDMTGSYFEALSRHFDLESMQRSYDLGTNKDLDFNLDRTE